MSIWKLLGRLIQVSPQDLWFITDESAGRLIYEKYDEAKGKSSDSSEFYEIKYASVFPRLKNEDPEVQGQVQVDLADKNMVEPLEDD